MSAMLWMSLGAATVFAGQAIGWWLACREAEAMRAAATPEREATYREAAPAAERAPAPELPFRCLWSETGWGEFCGEPCGSSGLCFEHGPYGPLKQLAMRRAHERVCDDPSCPHERPKGASVVSLAAWRSRHG